MSSYWTLLKVFLTNEWSAFLSFAGEVYDRMVEWCLLSPTQASYLILIVVIFFFLPIVYAWFKSRQVRTLFVELGFIAIPASLALLLLVPTGFAGTPDDNCTAYERGKMNFSLLDILTVPKDKSNVFGDAWLILYVQNERWGNDVHQCRISLTDPKARVLAKVVRDAQEGGSGGRFSRGEFTFSFGGRNEQPNVVIKGKKAFVKPYPPETPRAPGISAPAPTPAIPAVQGPN